MKIKLNHTITKRRGHSINFFADIDGEHIPSLYISQTVPMATDGIIDGELYDTKLADDIKKLANDIHKLVEKFNTND